MPLTDHPEAQALLDSILARVPAVRARLEAAGIRVRVLVAGERYIDASPELASMGIDVNAWPAPPAGLFVVPERTVYVRVLERGVLAHELGHAFDCALGGGVYLSYDSKTIRSAFENARRFVSAYAATGLDEYFAEGFRAMLGERLDAFPETSAAILRRKDPMLYGVLAGAMGVSAKAAA